MVHWRQLFRRRMDRHKSDKPALHQPPTPWTRLRRTLRAQAVAKARKFRCSPGCMKRQLVSTFPILDWLINYNIRSCLVGDVISGFTVGILNIPQGMAYGVLAGAESINGLYASFFPVLIYSALCTSQHASVGTFAVTSLMTGGIVNTVGKEMISHWNHTEMMSDNGTANYDAIPLNIRLQVTIAVTLAVGLWQVFMGILRLGYLAVFLSDHLVKGFTCAAAFHVFTSQIKPVFGMPKLQERYGPLKLIYFYYDFFAQIRTVHIPTLIVSVICISVLYLTRVLVNQNPRVMKIIRVPFPVELCVIIFGTLASYELDLESTWGVLTVHKIPTGLPPPQYPPYTIIPEVIGRTFSLAIVASAVLISLAKIFATKHQYKIDPNQELIAIGASNIFGSFFLCIPTTGALARSAVQESVGGSTQMVSLVSAVIVLIVLVSLGRFLQPLPKACLGSIIMVALINMLKGVLEVKRLWKLSLIDASIFMVTLLATLLLDVDYGLAIGVLYSLLTFAFRMQYGRVAVLGKVKGSVDEVKPLEEAMVEEISGVKIFRLHGPLYSGNAESFIAKIRKAINSNQAVLSSNLSPFPEADTTVTTAFDGTPEDRSEDLESRQEVARRQDQSVDGTVNIVQNNWLMAKGSSVRPLRVIIIDCSAINFVDVVGTENLLRLAKECGKRQIKLVFAACTGSVRDVLILAGILTVIPAENFVQNISDAWHES